MTLWRLSADRSKDLFEKGQITSERLISSCVERIAKTEKRIGSFLSLTLEQASEKAKLSDRRRHDGGRLSPIDGIPIALKDNIMTKGVRTTCASRMLAGYIPPFDATVVERLERAGAIIIGKTNLDEFAMGATTENSAFKLSRNPWNDEYSPGGSSGGSASAVAAGQVPFSLGSDTGGSVRLPAAFCGLTGLKPTYGRISRYGLIAYASSLDQIGIIARNARDCALLFDAVAGHDPRDSTSLPCPMVSTYEKLKLNETVCQGLRIGIPKEYFDDNLDHELLGSIEKARTIFRELGAVEVPLSLPLVDLAIETYYVISTAEASSNLARFDGLRYGYRSTDRASRVRQIVRTRNYGFGHEVKTRIILGTFVLSADHRDSFYLQARKVRQAIRQEFATAFAKVDLILTPPSPVVQARLGTGSIDPIMRYRKDVFVCPANLAFLPAIVFPIGINSLGLPLGLQLIGSDCTEPLLLAIADEFQRTSGIVDLLAGET